MASEPALSGVEGYRSGLMGRARLQPCRSGLRRMRAL